MKVLKWTLIIIGSLALLGFIGFQVLVYKTKKASPEETVEYKSGNIELSVFYCRPYKKEREIFGGLVPYGKVWRTGANEATTFTTNTLIMFGDHEVEPGTYTLWTVPEANTWSIILNSKMYGWGVNWEEQAMREAEFDVAQTTAPVQHLDSTVEQFTIKFDNASNLNLMWDKTKVTVPIEPIP